MDRIEPMTFRERMEDWWETIKVKWFMLDAQQKQALILIGIYLFQMTTEIMKSYITAKVQVANESE